MRVFEVVDGDLPGRTTCGVLRYDPARQAFTFEPSEDAGPQDVPAMFAPFVARGEAVPARWVNAWISERIAPSSRQNIGEVLRDHKLKEYDPAELLMSGEGRSTQDGFYVHEVGSGYRSGRTLGRELARARQEAGLTQSELALKSGLAQAVVSNIERGTSNPTMRTLERLADALGCELRVTFTR